VKGNAPVAGNVYVIQQGDTLFDIAQQQCGDGSLYRALAALNNIADPDVIQPGSSLTIDCEALHEWTPSDSAPSMPGANPDGSYG
jgi:hypothetical protein